MRISDWSSDVCSSDLATPEDARAFLAARGLKMISSAGLRQLENTDGKKVEVAAEPEPESESSPPPDAGSTDADAEFKAVWNSKEFRAAMKPLGSMPHRESEVAADMAQGWRDGLAGDAAALEQRYLADVGERVGAFQPNGFNPRQAYFEGFFAAVMGDAVQIRALETPGGTMGAAQAWERIDGKLRGEPEPESGPAHEPDPEASAQGRSGDVG